ncbi:SPFH domain-containing protein, partial [Streptomyces sp. AC495_CC817]|uniref:SPFH domain-containing protein n=1 Tax=Streptomyces sp. AC495_CC817 TaxID=2823900 RepID=UPI001C2576B1
SREEINSRLRAVLDDATGKWGIRVNRVEIKAIDPPHTIKEAMEKQMRAERDKRAAILHAEGERQAKILTAEGTKQKDILEAQGAQQAMILRADGEAKAVELVFQAVHRNNADPKILAYKYLETLPHLASSDNNTFWVIPGELTEAVRTVTRAFGDQSSESPPTPGQPEEAATADDHDSLGGSRVPQLEARSTVSFDAAAAADEAGKQAAAAVSDAKAEAEAAKSPQMPRRTRTSDD